MSDDRIERNIAALHERIKADTVRVDELSVKLNLANQAVMSLTQELSVLRVQVITLTAKVNSGTGRTSEHG
jgi:hypothetical protein